MMRSLWVFAVLVGVAWAVALWFNRRGVCRFDGSGDPNRGIVVFVEPVRWLFIVWCFNALCRALRRAGRTDAVYLYRWSRAAGSVLVLPDLMRRHRLDAKAVRLAQFIEQLRREHPASPIHLVGYSTGVYIAFESLRQMSPATTIGQVVALHGTVSPDYDMTEVTRRAKGVLTVHGRPDWLINGLGPLLFGTNDRVHTAACGMVGLRSAPAKVEQRGWQISDARAGYLGDHFTVMSRGWLRVNIISRLT
ncbi:MAG TPA: alpha/beta hydrolase [Phycisphaerae bacterium]|nr:alpha/beta hydrolase [Phycisphaerae bacterium]HRR84406.1 alpha/beta hydrolase [Phycisphaerae bacterium]